MPQEFHVLRCFACHLFQVHQTKKDKKWACKVWGEKQSLKKAYFIGSPRDCRNIVQKLNLESEGGKLNNEELPQSEELKLPVNVTKDDLYLEPVLEDCTNKEENPMESNCSPPMKKQRCHNSRPSVESKIGHSFVDISHHEPQVIDLPDYMKSSGISVDSVLNIENIQHMDDNLDITVRNPDSSTDSTLFCNWTEKPQISKNRGFQMILKAAKKLS